MTKDDDVNEPTTDETASDEATEVVELDDEAAVPGETTADDDDVAADDDDDVAADDDDVTADDDDVTAEEFDDQEALSAERPPRTLLRRLLVPVALAVLVIASIGVTTWFYLEQFRPDQQTGEAAKATAIKAATEGTTSLLSYSPDTLDKDFATAKTHLTGDFLNYYTQFTQDIVTPAAKQKAVKTSAAVVQSAVAEIHPDSAVVLLYLNQTTTSKENPDGSFTASSVKVGLKRVANDWLISAFDPV